ncbi:MAG TPA: hypothetical protein VNJ04_05035 [Gemmatimonadaceae bacterium]|nr:hypothetical protein [Gemmatimonadaceae bacterium]
MTKLETAFWTAYGKTPTEMDAAELNDVRIQLTKMLMQDRAEGLSPISGATAATTSPRRQGSPDLPAPTPQGHVRNLGDYAKRKEVLP